mmetsp:Transcript_29633/g.64479  ORF Transcript_29633/g.64479 Transcript_29633/m.64479 type:complete len:107 (-) Transcript_29633:1248-1568(-)
MPFVTEADATWNLGTIAASHGGSEPRGRHTDVIGSNGGGNKFKDVGIVGGYTRHSQHATTGALGDQVIRAEQLAAVADLATGRPTGRNNLGRGAWSWQSWTRRCKV